jgi:hypothetical protein
LGLPFGGTFGHLSYQLHPVTETVLLSDEIVAALQPVSFSPELERDFPTDFTILQHTHRHSFSRMQYDLYFQSLRNQRTYGRIIALPLYENGVIFSNVFDLNASWQKGLIVRSFLQTINPSQWPTIIIAIDDNALMLENIQMKCAELDITFYGIHFIAPRHW